MSNKKRKPYTKKELDAMAERIIADGKDIVFTHKGKKYILDVKLYAAEREYNKTRGR